MIAGTGDTTIMEAMIAGAERICTTGTRAMGISKDIIQIKITGGFEFKFVICLILGMLSKRIVPEIIDQWELIFIILHTKIIGIHAILPIRIISGTSDTITEEAIGTTGYFKTGQLKILRITTVVSTQERLRTTFERTTTQIITSSTMNLILNNSSKEIKIIDTTTGTTLGGMLNTFHPIIEGLM